MSTGTRISGRPVQPDERARKREAIGLAPQRPTAKTVLHAPPDAQRGSLRWLAVLFVLLLALATGWLLWQAVTAPDGSADRSADGGSAVEMAIAAGSASDPLAQAAASGRLLVRDDFIEPQFPLPSRADEAVTLGFLGDLYQIQVDKPGGLAWATLGQADLGSYRLESDLRLAADEAFSWGYGGLISRFQNDENFYLFVVDSRGQYQIQLIRTGVWRTVRPWTPSPALADSLQNVLAVADDGATLRFLINGTQVDAVTDPQLPVGDVGLVVAARSQGRAKGLFDWVALYETAFGE